MNAGCAIALTRRPPRLGRYVTTPRRSQKALRQHCFLVDNDLLGSAVSVAVPIVSIAVPAAVATTTTTSSASSAACTTSPAHRRQSLAC
jgi:hypothetical protein